MKLYIDQLNINALKDIKKEFKELYVHSESYILMFSTQGIYKLTNKDSKRLTIVDKDVEVHKNYYDIFTLIKDPSIITLEDWHQIQPAEVTQYVHRAIYKVSKQSSENKQSSISFVIEEHLVNGQNILYDIYFEVPDNINISQESVKEEISVFLSRLN